MITSRKLAISCDLPRLQADLATVAPTGWHPHFNTGYYTGDWSGIDLRAIPGGHMPLHNDPTRDDFTDTAVLSQCEYVPEFLAELECPLESVRFLRLAAGSSIREHRDAGLCVENGSVRLHIAVHTNPEVVFVVGGSQISVREGECWYINFDLAHSVDNRGATDRVHLVIDAKVNDWLQMRLESVR